MRCVLFTMTNKHGISTNECIDIRAMAHGKTSIHTAAYTPAAQTTRLSPFWWVLTEVGRVAPYCLHAQHSRVVQLEKRVGKPYCASLVWMSEKYGLSLSSLIFFFFVQTFTPSLPLISLPFSSRIGLTDADPVSHFHYFDEKWRAVTRQRVPHQHRRIQHYDKERYLGERAKRS